MNISGNYRGMEITTNIECPNDCVYCPQEKLMRFYKERSNVLQMSFETFRTCIDKMPKDVNIHFSGMSEPWLNTDCTKMLLYARKRGHGIVVATTLAGMKLSDIDAIEDIPFKRFMLHLPCEEGYEKIPINDVYLKVLSRLIDSKIKTRNFLYGKRLHPQIQEIIGNNTIPQKICSRAGNVDGVPIIQKKEGSIICKRGCLQNILLPNGDVDICCSDYELKYILGNLLSASYESLFNGKEFNKIQKGLADSSLDTLCRYCEGAVRKWQLFLGLAGR